MLRRFHILPPPSSLPRRTAILPFLPLSTKSFFSSSTTPKFCSSTSSLANNKKNIAELFENQNRNLLPSSPIASSIKLDADDENELKQITKFGKSSPSTWEYGLLIGAAKAIRTNNPNLLTSLFLRQEKFSVSQVNSALRLEKDSSSTGSADCFHQTQFLHFLQIGFSWLPKEAVQELLARQVESNFCQIAHLLLPHQGKKLKSFQGTKLEFNRYNYLDRPERVLEALNDVSSNEKVQEEEQQKEDGFPNLRSFSFTGSTFSVEEQDHEMRNLSYDKLFKFLNAESSPNLEELSLSKMIQSCLTDEVFQYISSSSTSLSKLKKVSLNRCDGISGEGLKYLQSCSLETLWIYSDGSSPTTTRIQLQESLPLLKHSLKSLSLHLQDQIPLREIAEPISKLENLSSLTLITSAEFLFTSGTNLKEEEEDLTKFLIQSLPKLTELDLNVNTTISPFDAKDEQKANDNTSSAAPISFGKEWKDAFDAKVLPLKKLSLSCTSDSSRATDIDNYDFLSSSSVCHGLEELSLLGMVNDQNKDSFLKNLKYCTKLKELTLIGVSSSSAASTPLDQNLLEECFSKIATNLKKLRILDVDSSSRKCANLINDWSFLRHLFASSSSSSSSSSQSSSLQSLILENCNLTDKDAQNIFSLHHHHHHHHNQNSSSAGLDFLSLQGSKITGKEWLNNDNNENIISIKHIELSNCIHLQDLSFLKNICPQNLERLEFYHCYGLSQIGGVKILEEIASNLSSSSSSQQQPTSLRKIELRHIPFPDFRPFELGTIKGGRKLSILDLVRPFANVTTNNGEEEEECFFSNLEVIDLRGSFHDQVNDEFGFNMSSLHDEKFGTLKTKEELDEWDEILLKLKSLKEIKLRH